MSPTALFLCSGVAHSHEKSPLCQQIEFGPKNDIGKRSIEIVGERNGMNGKQVQRYIRLTELVPDLQKAIDQDKLGFTSAVEISFISKKNQNFIALKRKRGNGNDRSLNLCHQIDLLRLTVSEIYRISSSGVGISFSHGTASQNALIFGSVLHRPFSMAICICFLTYSVETPS